MVTKDMMLEALRTLGVREGDILLTHSSFKSLGGCENGADTVVSAMLEAVGKTGTVVFPTLCQKDWDHVYENWHLDAPSDVGYLTNYFRKLEGAKRSDQATHSVAAMGALADTLTATHGQSGLRYGIFGDTPFSADSPWQKMYERDAKVLFLGCSVKACTFRHLAEYIVMEEYLERIKGSPDCEALKSEVWHYTKYKEYGVWPHIKSPYLEELLRAEGKWRETTCGDATLALVSSRDFVDLSIRLMKAHCAEALSEYPPLWTVAETLDWMTRVEAL